MNTFLVKYKEEKEEGLILFDGQQDENKNSLFERAINYISQKDTVSTSDLQGVLRVGHAKASRLMEDLHSRGMVGERGKSNRGRAVLI